MEKHFQLKASSTDIRREAVGGLTIFLTMAYIIFVNPEILSDAGMDRAALITATERNGLVVGSTIRSSRWDQSRNMEDTSIVPWMVSPPWKSNEV